MTSKKKKKKKNSQNDLRQYLLNFDGFTARELPGQNHVSLTAYPTTRRSLSHTSLPVSIQLLSSSFCFGLLNASSVFGSFPALPSY